MAFSKKSKLHTHHGLKKSRKQLRKEMRQNKKVKKSLYMGKKKRGSALTLETNIKSIPQVKRSDDNKKKHMKPLPGEYKPKNHKEYSSEELQRKDKIKQKRLEKEMMQERKRKLLEANVEDDRIIKEMEKKLGLNKRKSKTIPKGFKEDGLDYLLELCDPDGIKSAIATEQTLDNVNDEFDEDFALVLGTSNKKLDDIGEDDYSDGDQNNCEGSEDEESNSESYSSEEPSIQEEESNSDEMENELSADEESAEEITDKVKKLNKNLKRKQSDEDEDKQSKKRRVSDTSEGSVDENEGSEQISIKGAVKINPDGTWEDIYGRLRCKDGKIITQKEESIYIPPALRQNNNKSEKLVRLKKQLKGLLNRLTESNMHSITVSIEEMYMNNTRNDMNDTLTSLILETLVTNTTTPERLLIEHVVLLTVLHANVGAEVGAHFLQKVATHFDELLANCRDVEDKKLDNITKIIAQMYNFQLFDFKLVYDVLRKLCNYYDEKCIECILHILRNVGFNLRKDNPLELKNFIMEVQQKAANISDEDKDNSRVKFMLDILLAIRNNNVKKIPNYDVSYPEHLKKVMKGFIRKGNYVTQLNISLEDLLNVEEKGKWWVVGSAWVGKDNTEKNKSDTNGNLETYSQSILELARQQHMNTDTRRSIFCIIMSAEDYLDAFDKILHLGLKGQQEREIVNVLLHCCLREKNYNPYYAVLAQKFCDYDRKFQIMIKYCTWDKLKTLETWSHQISNLTKLLIHLFIEKGLVISILKVVQFSELDKVTLRFMRQILIGVLLHKDEEACLQVFMRVSRSDKLKMFRESLRLFIHHFLLKNLKSDVVTETQRMLLENRAKAVEKILSVKDAKW